VKTSRDPVAYYLPQKTHRSRAAALKHQLPCRPREARSARAILGRCTCGGAAGRWRRGRAGCLPRWSMIPRRWGRAVVEARLGAERQRLFRIIEELVPWENSEQRGGAAPRTHGVERQAFSPRRWPSATPSTPRRLARRSAAALVPLEAQRGWGGGLLEGRPRLRLNRWRC